MSKNAQNQLKLILHFNIDKTLVMRDSLNSNNTEYYVRKNKSNLKIIKFLFSIKFNLNILYFI